MIFDTGASFHISAEFSHLLEPLRCHVGIIVRGGACTHATHIGSVQLNMEISGSVLSVTISDVVYTPDWNEAFLMSCRKIDMLGHFPMVGEDGIIKVQCKSNHSPVCIRESIHGCYQVLPLARHNKIFTAATDFWQQALAHSTTRLCSTATDIYADSSILPERTSEYFCAACAKYNRKHTVPPPVSNQQYKHTFNCIHSHRLVPLSVESL